MASEEVVRSVGNNLNVSISMSTQDYVDMRINEIKELMAVHTANHEAEHRFTDLALDKAQEAEEKRFASVNEFRAQLTDQANTFARTDTIDVRLASIQAQYDAKTGANSQRIDTLTAQVLDRFDNFTKVADNKAEALQRALSEKTDALAEKTEGLARSLATAKNTSDVGFGDRLTLVERQLLQQLGARGGADTTVRWIFTSVGFLLTLLSIAAVLIALFK